MEDNAFRSIMAYHDVSVDTSSSHFHSVRMDLRPRVRLKAHEVVNCRYEAMHLGTLVVVTDADGALLAETLAPEATEVNVGLGELGVNKSQAPKMGLARMSRTA
jgi:hypothetical protein